MANGLCSLISTVFHCICLYFWMIRRLTVSDAPSASKDHQYRILSYSARPQLGCVYGQNTCFPSYFLLAETFSGVHIFFLIHRDHMFPQLLYNQVCVFSILA